jgi:hypothetical protein
MKSWLSDVMGGRLPGIVFFAVPACAIFLADLSIFVSQPSKPAEVRRVAAQLAADESVLLPNWQFTGGEKTHKTTKTKSVSGGNGNNGNGNGNNGKGNGNNGNGNGNNGNGNGNNGKGNGNNGNGNGNNGKGKG